MLFQSYTSGERRAAFHLLHARPVVMALMNSLRFTFIESFCSLCRYVIVVKPWSVSPPDPVRLKCTLEAVSRRVSDCAPKQSHSFPVAIMALQLSVIVGVSISLTHANDF